MKRMSIRWRLTLWYGAVLAAVLVAFSVAVFWELRRDLLQRVDDGLHEELTDVLFEMGRATSAEGLLEWLDRRFGRHEGFDFQITNEEGQRFFASQRLAKRMLPVAKSVSTTETFETINTDGRFRVIEVQATGPQGPLSIQIARSLESFDHELSELLFVFMVTGPATLFVTLGSGYFLAGRALGPVQAITRTADQITAERLDRRIEVVNPDDDLGALSRTLNGMIERLESSFHDMQRFTADAAHELRTPLAIIRNEAEVTLRAARSTEEYSHTLENILEETARLTQLSDHLLFLCRQDAGLYTKATDPLAVNDLIQDVVSQMQLLAQEKNITLSLEKNTPCQVVADAAQLRRVCYNLLDNAIKYSPIGGRVTVSSTVQNGSVKLIVADNGIGIAAEHLAHVFERFYRVDPSRNRDTEGTGLGLAISQAIVEAHAGEIGVESVLGQGTRFVVRLPIRPSKEAM
jgi:two-component system heavy metal sensor histidine kinase CusS